jgi:hypothetical protein
MMSYLRYLYWQNKSNLREPKSLRVEAPCTTVGRFSSGSMAIGR